MDREKCYTDLFFMMEEMKLFLAENEPKFRQFVMEQFEKRLPDVLESLKEAVVKMYVAGEKRDVQSSYRFSAMVGGREIVGEELNQLLQEWWKKYSSKTQCMYIAGARLAWKYNPNLSPRFGGSTEFSNLREWDSPVLKVAKAQMDREYEKVYGEVLSDICERLKEKITQMKAEMKKKDEYSFNVNMSHQPEVLLKAVGNDICLRLNEQKRFFSDCKCTIHESTNWLLCFSMTIQF